MFGSFVQVSKIRQKLVGLVETVVRFVLLKISGLGLLPKAMLLEQNS